MPVSSTRIQSASPPCSTTFVRRAAITALSRGCAITKPHATRISTGTTSSNTELGSVRRSTAPVSPPKSDPAPRTVARCCWPCSSRRYPNAPLTEPNTSPTVLLTFATTGE